MDASYNFTQFKFICMRFDRLPQYNADERVVCLCVSLSLLLIGTFICYNCKYAESVSTVFLVHFGSSEHMRSRSFYLFCGYAINRLNVCL